jgi:predicted Zn-dependent peptidase
MVVSKVARHNFISKFVILSQNMKISRFLNLILILIISVALFTSKAQAEDFTELLSNFESKVFYKTLDNGLKVIIYKRDYAPIFSGVVAVNVGGVDEIPGKTGLAHILEHMAFKGTSTFGSKNFSRERKLLQRLETLILASDSGNNPTPEQQQEITEVSEQLNDLVDRDNTLDKIYSRLGEVGLNATTSKELTNYFVSLPKNVFPTWCWLEAERIKRPVFREFYKERDVVMEERRMRFDDDPGQQLYQMILAQSFTLHPYRDPVIGYAEDLKRLTATDTKIFHKQYYIPNNMVVSLVGDLDPETTFKQVEACFGDLKPGPIPPRVKAIEPTQKGERQFTLTVDAERQLGIAYHKPNYPNPEDLPLMLWLELQLSGSTSPLYRELVLKRKLATSVDYFEAPGSKFPNLYIIAAIPNGDVSNKTLLAGIDEVLDSELAKPIDVERLKIIKRRMLVQHLSGLGSNLGLALNFAESELIYGDWKINLKWIANLEQITPAEILSVARKYLVRSNRTIGFLEKKK